MRTGEEGLADLKQRLENAEERITQATNILFEHLWIDDAQHKQYAIDQALRILFGDEAYRYLKSLYVDWDNGRPAKKLKRSRKGHYTFG